MPLLAFCTIGTETCSFLGLVCLSDGTRLGGSPHLQRFVTALYIHIPCARLLCTVCWQYLEYLQSPGGLTNGAWTL